MFTLVLTIRTFVDDSYEDSYITFTDVIDTDTCDKLASDIEHLLDYPHQRLLEVTLIS